MRPQLQPSYPNSVARAGSRPLIDAVAHLANGCSFEIAARDREALDAARDQLASGTLVSVTWLRGDTHDDRVAAARAIRDAGLNPLPHLAARFLLDQPDADTLVARLADEAGVDQLFVIGGDVAVPSGEFGSALELLARLRLAARGYRRVGFAGYPEGHPTVDRTTLDTALDTKIAVAEDAGLSPFVVTQFGFDAAPIVAWLEAFRARGNAAPVHVGLAGPASVRTLLRYARICGVGTSTRAMLAHHGSLTRLLRDSGPDPVIRDLAAASVRERCAPVSLHLFPFGGLAHAARWIAPVAHGQITLHPNGCGFDPQP